MLKGFEFETQPLTPYEANTLLPVFVWCLESKVGKAMCVTNGQITTGMKKKGYKVSEPRVRKIINHIRMFGLVPGLIATSEGYYVATTEKELDDYIESLNGRVVAIAGIMRCMKDQKARMFPKYEPSLFTNL